MELQQPKSFKPALAGPQERNFMAGYIGSKDKPEDKDNHEAGKWCYVVEKHCDNAYGQEVRNCQVCLSDFHRQSRPPKKGGDVKCLMGHECSPWGITEPG